MEDYKLNKNVTCLQQCKDGCKYCIYNPKYNCSLGCLSCAMIIYCKENGETI